MAMDFEFIGGDPSIDLVNTQMHRQHSGGPDELLDTGEDARCWFEKAGLISPAQVDTLDHDAALLAARRLRSALDAIYRPIAQGRDDPAGSERGLATLNAVLDQGRERVQVGRAGAGYARAARFEVLGPADPSVQVADAAARLLHRLESHRLKECENPECDLLFYDESRNNSRRWCSMQSCGNVHKQTRFRQAARTRQPRG